MSTILIAEDEEILREELRDALQQQGHTVLQAPDGIAALDQIKGVAIQVVVTDLRMPGLTGLDVIRRGKEVSPETQFVIMTAFGSMETAIEALRLGAADYLIKPLSIDELLTKVGRIVENQELRSANRMLRRDLERKIGTLEMIGNSAPLNKIRETIQKVAPTRSSVLIHGESGSGKELIARGIHKLGAARNEPFVAVNCAAIPETLIESELFGHQRGAFTGAVADSEGLFRAARKGTLFLDEIGELPLAMQAKLLRALEERIVTPVGSVKRIPFEARVVSATNRDLRAEIEKKTFREDLYFRLAVMELHAPPLRERRDDIPLLAQHFVQRFNAELGRSYQGLDESALRRVMDAPWKGNIRELQNTIERAMILGTEPHIKEADLTLPFSSNADGTMLTTKNLREAVHQFEQAHIRRILTGCEGDKRKAAQELGISLSSLYRYLEETPPAGTA